MKAVDEFERKEAALQELLDHLSNEGDGRRSARNSALASNEIAWEVGAFSEEEDDEHAGGQAGLIVRARRDALLGALNSGDTLDAIHRVERALRVQARLLQFISALVGAMFAGLVVYFWERS